MPRKLFSVLILIAFACSLAVGQANQNNFSAVLPMVNVATQPGTTFDVRLNNCLAQVSSAGITCDARTDVGGTVANSITISQSNVAVLLPATTITFGTNKSLTVSGNN